MVNMIRRIARMREWLKVFDAGGLTPPIYLELSGEEVRAILGALDGAEVRIAEMAETSGHEHCVRGYEIAKRVAVDAYEAGDRVRAQLGAAELELRRLRGVVGAAQRYYDAATRHAAGRVSAETLRDHEADLGALLPDPSGLASCPFAEIERLRSAFLKYIAVYGGADHHADDCPRPNTCLLCDADRAANAALGKGGR
jgi:hypothetical protein